MPSAGVQALEERRFDVRCSSASAAVRELCAARSGPLPTGLPAPPDSAGTLGGRPTAPAFALPCSGLPPERHRTHGLAASWRGAAAELDCAGTGTPPGLMDLLSHAPRDAGKRAASGQGLRRDLARLDDAGGANRFGGVAVGSLVRTQWPREKEHWPVHEGQEAYSTSACTELGDSLRSLGGEPAEAQGTPWSPPDPMRAATGMTADGAGQYSGAGERSTRGNPGAPPGAKQSTEAAPGPAGGEGTATDTSASLAAVDSGQGQLRQRGEEMHLLAAAAMLSASSGAGEEARPRPSSPPSPRQNGTDFCDSRKSSPALWEEDKLAAGARRRSERNSEASRRHVQGSVLSGPLVWAEGMGVHKGVCGAEEGTPAGKGDAWNQVNCGPFGATTEETPLQAPWNGELCADRKNQRGLDSHSDHPDRCLCCGVQRGDCVQRSWRCDDADSSLVPGSHADPVGQLAGVPKAGAESPPPSLLSSPPWLSGDLRAGPSGLNRDSLFVLVVDGNERAGSRNRVGGQRGDRPRGDRDLVGSCRAANSGRLRGQQGRGWRGRRRCPLPSSVPAPFAPARDRSGRVKLLCSPRPSPARETISQVRIQLLANQGAPPPGRILLDWNTETSKRETLMCQEAPLEEPPAVASSSAEAQGPLGGPSSGQEGWQDVSPHSPRRRGPFREGAPGLVSEQLATEAATSKGVHLCPQWASEVSGQSGRLLGLAAQVAAKEFRSVSETIAAGLAGALGRKMSLQFKSKRPVFTADRILSWPGLVTFAAASRPKCPSQGHRGSVAASPLSWVLVGVQPAREQGLGLSPGAARPASSSPNALCFSPAKQHPAMPRASFESVTRAALWNSDAGGAAHGGAAVHPLLESRKLTWGAGVGPLRVDIVGEIVLVTLRHPPKEMALPVGEERKEGSLTAGTLALLLPFLPIHKSPSGPFLEGLQLPVRGEEVALPFTVQVQMWPPFLCVSERASGCGWRNVEGFRKPLFAHQPPQTAGHALQTGFPTASSPAVSCRMLCWQPLGGNRLEQSASPPASQGRSFPSAQTGQGLAEALWKGSLLTVGPEALRGRAGSPGAGGCQMPTRKGTPEASQAARREGARKAEGPLKRRWRGCAREAAVKLGGHVPQTSAGSRRAKDAEGAGPSGAGGAKWHRTAGPLRALGGAGALSPALPGGSHSCLLRAGSPVRVHRGLPWLKRPPGMPCVEAPPRGQPRAAAARWLRGRAALIRNPPAIPARYKFKAAGKGEALERLSAPKQSSRLAATGPPSPTKDPACLQRPFSLDPKRLMLWRSRQGAQRPGRLGQPLGREIREASSRTSSLMLRRRGIDHGSRRFKAVGSRSPEWRPTKPVEPMLLLDSGTRKSWPISAVGAWPFFCSLLGLVTPSAASLWAVWGERAPLEASQWGPLALLLSKSSVAPRRRDPWTLAGPSGTPASHSAAGGEGSRTVTQRGPGRGLPTALALFSPFCYRLWTRKRNPRSCHPALRTMTVLQLSRGLQGLQCPTFVLTDLFSSSPSALGRALALWSPPAPPSGPSASAPLLPKGGVWQPASAARSSLGFRNSCAMVPPVLGQLPDAPKATDEVAREPPSAASLPTSCAAGEAAPPPLGVPAPEFQLHPLGDLGGPAPALPQGGSRLGKADAEKRLKKVSQIRIRKTVPKPDPNLTPMGLPRPKRLKKTEFSLEEIYTNKNYKSPPSSRSLETIFEEPKERNGSLVSISQQKRKRVLEFQDFTLPRKRKARSKAKGTGGSTRAQKAALQGRELDVLLLQRLTDLERFFAKEEEQQKASSG